MSMKLLSVFLLGYVFVLISCGSKKDNSQLTESDIRGSWEQITYQDGKWIIFKPCNASNMNVTWRGDTLLIEWGQEVTAEKINRISSSGGKFSLEGIEVYVTGAAARPIHIEPVDSMQGVTRWWLYEEDEPRLLVRDKFKAGYHVVEEKCEGEDRD